MRLRTQLTHLTRNELDEMASRVAANVALANVSNRMGFGLGYILDDVATRALTEREYVAAVRLFETEHPDLIWS